MSVNFSSIEGHIASRNFKAAVDELCQIRTGHQGTMEALQLWAKLHAAQLKWGNVDVVCRTMRQDFPNETFGFLQGAESLHQQGRTPEAMALLQQNQASMGEDAGFLYQMARFECAVDNLSGANLLLRKAFDRNGSLREQALGDRDLSKVWNDLQPEGALAEPAVA